MALNIVEKIDNTVKVNNVLISLSDKTGLEGFVKRLIAINPGVKLYSTGGTYAKIKEILPGEWEKNLISVSDYTGQPEMQGGLVKTLDFKIYLGILSETYNDDHKKDLARTDAVSFDMVVVNLYPFKKTIEQDGITPEAARSNIDIGGPCMLRASAKNFLRVVSVCDPGDYDAICDEMEQNSGTVSLERRIECAKKTFNHTAEYDTMIAAYLKEKAYQDFEKIYQLQN